MSVSTRILDVASTDTPDRFTLARCDDCGVLRTLPVPADLAPYYATDLAGTMTEPSGRGVATAPILMPSLYRSLRVRGWPPWLYERFGPTSFLTAVTAPANLLVPGNVRWLVARV